MLHIIEKSNVEYEFHSTQINLNDFQSEKDYRFFNLQRQIPEENIYREFPQIENEKWKSLNILQDDPNEKYGLENEYHITVCYGLKNECEYFKLRKLLSEFNEFEIEFGNVSSFRRDEKPYDVLKVDIISQQLNDLHYLITSNVENEQSFPEYQPHMTLGYIKKGTCIELEKPANGLTGTKLLINKIVFSHADNYYLDLPLKNNREI
jgi:hypothetical protein